MEVERYNLKKSFRDIGEFATWVKSNCGKCALQMDGSCYGCALLKSLDTAITSDWTISEPARNSIGLPNEKHYKKPEQCALFVSKRAKNKPAEEKAP